MLNKEGNNMQLNHSLCCNIKQLKYISEDGGTQIMAGARLTVCSCGAVVHQPASPVAESLRARSAPSISRDGPRYNVNSNFLHELRLDLQTS